MDFRHLQPPVPFPVWLLNQAGCCRSGEQRSESPDRPVHGDTVDFDLTLAQQLLAAAVGAPVPQIPPDREDDDLGRNRNPTNAELEILGIGWCDQESSRDALPPTAAFRHFTVPYGLPYPPLKIYGLKRV